MRAGANRDGRDDERPQPRRVTEGALRLLVMADFSGRGARGEVAELAGRPIMPVDVDNFDQVMARLAPRLELAGEDPAPWRAALEFAE